MPPILLFRLLVYDQGPKLGPFGSSEETAQVYQQKHSLSILATPHADTPRDDFSSDEIHFGLNTGSSIWARVLLSPKVAFTVVSDQSPSNTYEWSWALTDCYS